MECGQDAYVDLMKRYFMVTDAFLRLKPGYQKVWYSLPTTSISPAKAIDSSQLLCFRNFLSISRKWMVLW